MKKILAGILVAATFAAAAPHIHDGFFMNFQLGLGYFRQNSDWKSYENGHYNDRVDGKVTAETWISQNFTFMAGGSINETVTIFGTLSISGSDNGIETNISSREGNMSIAQLFFGPGVRLIPVHSGPLADFYLDAAAGWIFESCENNSYSGNYDLDFTASGLGLQLGLGKEWWVSKNWLLGLGIFYTAAFSDADEFDANVDVLSNVVQLRFTITRN